MIDSDTARPGDPVWVERWYDGHRIPATIIGKPQPCIGHPDVVPVRWEDGIGSTGWACLPLEKRETQMTLIEEKL